MSAPGTNTATGAQTAKSGTWSNPVPAATSPTMVVDTKAARNGTIASASRKRRSTMLITPTRAPTPSATRTAHHGQRNTTARPAEVRALPRIHGTGAGRRVLARIARTRAGISARAMEPLSRPSTTRLARADCRAESSMPSAFTIVAAPVAVSLTMTSAGRTPTASSGPMPAASRAFSSAERTSVTELPASRRSAPRVPRSMPTGTASPSITSTCGSGRRSVLRSWAMALPSPTTSVDASWRGGPPARTGARARAGRARPARVSAPRTVSRCRGRETVRLAESRRRGGPARRLGGATARCVPPVGLEPTTRRF